MVCRWLSGCLPAAVAAKAAKVKKCIVGQLYLVKIVIGNGVEENRLFNFRCTNVQRA